MYKYVNICVHVQNSATCTFFTPVLMSILTWIRFYLWCRRGAWLLPHPSGPAAPRPLIHTLVTYFFTPSSFPRPGQSSQVRSNFKSEFSRSLEPLLSVMGKGRGDPHAGVPSGRSRGLQRHPVLPFPRP